MTRETLVGAVVNRIVVAHNRLRRSEITAAEFDQFAIERLLAFADAEGAAMRERAADRFQKAIEDGYPTPAAEADQCEHGQFGWEDCIACYDVALLAAVDDVRALPATGEVGRG